MKRSFVLFCVVCLVAFSSAGKERGKTSALWGAAGEKWSPTSRLPDFSFAGYHRGEQAIRTPTDSISVADFGAKGDGKADDTAAFQEAIRRGEGKVIRIPAGRFALNDLLEIRRSNIVLQGAGPGKTTLLFRKPGETLRPKPAKTDGNQPTTGWSWGGGLIMIGGKRNTKTQTVAVTADARRGDSKLALAENRFKTGDEIVLTLNDDEKKSLVQYLYRSQSGNIDGLNNWKVQQVFRVTAVSSDTVSLDRGLRFDVRKAWRPAVAAFQPSVTEVGVEGVSFVFPPEPYQGHFKEVGFNPIVIDATAAHCWIRDIEVRNGDSGPYVGGFFCTLDGVRLTADPARVSKQGQTGHHGITLYGHDCLCTRFSIETQFIHDVTVQSAIGCVFSQGRAQNLSMDHHRWAPYENLFTDLDGGDGSRLFASSGGGQRGAHTAAGETFWNIRTKKPVAWPKNLGIDAIQVVGLNTPGEPTVTSGRWIESIPPLALQPADLHAAMAKKRMSEKTSSATPTKLPKK